MEAQGRRQNLEKVPGFGGVGLNSCWDGAPQGTGDSDDTIKISLGNTIILLFFTQNQNKTLPITLLRLDKKMKFKKKKKIFQ